MKKIIKNIKCVKIVDKVLVIFMILILLQSAFSLFGIALRENETIDIIVKTVGAAIFGYFLSSNFMPKKEKKAECSIKNRSGKITEKLKTLVSCEQVIIISSVGLISFVMLLMFRNHMEMDPKYLPTLSQLRDFTFSSIGFLIGSPVAEQEIE